MINASDMARWRDEPNDLRPLYPELAWVFDKLDDAADDIRDVAHLLQICGEPNLPDALKWLEKVLAIAELATRDEPEGGFGDRAMARLKRLLEGEGPT